MSFLYHFLQPPKSTLKFQSSLFPFSQRAALALKYKESHIVCKVERKNVPFGCPHPLRKHIWWRLCEPIPAAPEMAPGPSTLRHLRSPLQTFILLRQDGKNTHSATPPPEAGRGGPSVPVYKTDTNCTHLTDCFGGIIRQCQASSTYICELLLSAVTLVANNSCYFCGPQIFPEQISTLHSWTPRMRLSVWRMVDIKKKKLKCLLNKSS